MGARANAKPRGISRYSTFMLALPLLVAPTTWAETVTTFDDIQYWIGTGANRAAVVFDWDETTNADEALVWGYRWDGSATGEDMLRDVLVADERLFAKLSLPSGSGTRLYGWGFDRNEDCQFGLNDGTTFDSDGLAISGPPDLSTPAALSLDPADNYAEGWYSGFWHYGVSSNDPFDGGSWTSGSSGMTVRSLADGDWDGWTFSQTFNFSVFPENPRAAAPPLTADFDCDAEVDGADFLVWQRGFGITPGATRSQGDATSDGNVDGDDLLQWSSQFGNSHIPNGIASHFAGIAIPEPTCSALALCGFLVYLFSMFLTERRVS